MKNTQGFTLIELLVVVLIIGILSAVALPQYQKTVEKTKAAQAFSIIRSIAAAQESFYLTNGSYTDSFDNLEVDMPWPQTGPDWVGLGISGKSDGNWTVQFYYHTAAQGIAVGRISGPYAGAGFLYLFESSVNWPTRQIICMERKTLTSVAFAKEDGAYCQKFFPELHYIKR